MTPNPYVRGQDGSWIGFLDAPKNLPAPNMTKVQPLTVSMNAEKISRPFAALPLQDSNAHGPPCISSFKQMRTPVSIHPSYTTWEKSRVG